MNNTIFMLKARLADNKKSLESLQLRADNYIIILMQIIDPYTKDFTTLELDRALITLQDFVKLQKKAKDIKEEIARMEADLDG